LEVECEPLMEGLEILSELPIVNDVALFGALLHVTVLNAQTAVPKIESALNRENIRMLRVERIEPALEDVFVSLIARETEFPT